MRGGSEVFRVQTSPIKKASRVRGGSGALPRRASARSRLAVVSVCAALRAYTELSVCARERKAHTFFDGSRYDLKPSAFF